MTDMPVPPAGGAAVTGAGLGARLIARIIDGLLAIAMLIPLAIVAIIAAAINETLGLLVWIVVFVAWLAAMLYVFAWGLGETGQTPGKRSQGLQLVDVNTGHPVGGGRGVGRWFLESIINQFCYINWLWAIFDANNQTIADKVITANVVPGPKGGIMPIFPDGNPI